MKTLIELYMMEDLQLHNHLKKKLKKHGYKIKENITQYHGKPVPAYLLGLPTSKHDVKPIMLVSHLDTVHDVKPNINDFKRTNAILTANGKGLGADDRNGVYAILRMLQKGHRPYILFTHLEECGGVGVKQFLLDYKKPVGDIKFLVEVDRKGIGEAVFYNCKNEEFKNLIKTYGFKDNHGSYTDIVDIMREWDIAGVNLSAGYENAHSRSELTNISSLNFTLAGLHQILMDSDTLEHYKAKLYVYKAPTYKPPTSHNWNPQRQGQFDLGEVDEEEDPCINCQFQLGWTECDGCEHL